MTQWRVGESVPWSVSWTGEGEFGLEPSIEFPGAYDLTQIERPGEGLPRFAAVHVSRQRRALSLHLCHVCGWATTADDRWLFPAHSGGFVTLTDGSLGYGCNVPPVHEACADRARAQCPHLGGYDAAPTRFPSDDEGRLIARYDVVPGMEALAARLPPGLQVVFSAYRLFGPAFTEHVRVISGDGSGRPAAT